MDAEGHVTQISASAMQTVLNMKCFVLGRPLIHYVKITMVKGNFFCVSCNAYDSKYCLLMINMCTINILIMAMHISFMT